jgi:hypothetical protein
MSIRVHGTSDENDIRDERRSEESLLSFLVIGNSTSVSRDITDSKSDQEDEQTGPLQHVQPPIRIRQRVHVVGKRHARDDDTQHQLELRTTLEKRDHGHEVELADSFDHVPV